MKALCLYVLAGKGHYIPAKAVHDSLLEMGVESRIEEVFTYLGAGWLGRFNNHFWRLMLRFPALERHIVKFFDKDSGGIGMLARYSDAALRKNLIARLKEFSPDFVFATHPYGSAIMSEMLSDLGLDICATHEGGQMIVEEPERVIERLSKLHCKYTAYPWPHIIPSTRAEAVDLARRINASAEKLAAAGQVLCYHNHDIEFMRMEDGSLILELLYDNAPALQGEIDTFWVQAGGQNPADWVRKLSGRMPLLHLRCSRSDRAISTGSRSSPRAKPPESNISSSNRMSA